MDNLTNPFEVTAPSTKVSSKYAFISTKLFVEDMSELGWTISSTTNRSRNGLGKHAVI